MKEKFTSTIGSKVFSMAFIFLVLNLFSITASQAQIIQVTGSPQSATTTGTTLTVTRPSGLAVNDVMIANIIQSDDDNATLSNASLSGWTVIDGRAVGSNGGDEWWGTVLYKVATASDVAAANFAFTLDNDANGDGSAGTIIAFRNVNVTGGFNATGTANSGPFDIDPGTISTSTANTVTATTTTTNTANAAVIMLAMLGDNVTYSGWETATGPLALTELYEQPFNTTLDNGTAAAWAIKSTAGSTGAGTADLSGTARGGALLITLRCFTPSITTSGTATAVCTSSTSQTTSLAYTATTNNPIAYSIDWNAAANTAGLTDQSSTAHAFAGGAGTITNINIPASVPAGTYTGTMSITRSAGCPATQAITLTINGPSANAGTALSAICQGSTSAALGGSVGGTATGGTWSDGGVGGTFNPNATTLNATWTPPVAYTGTATLTLTTSGGSCGTTSASKNQLVTSQPTIAAAGNDNTFCIGAITLTANSAVVGTGAWTIQSGPNTSTAQITGGLNNPTATFTPTAAGTYTLRWTISNSPCTASFDQVVYTVNALPQVTAFSGNTICTGDIGQLTATLTGASPFSVTYNPGSVNEPVTSNVPFNVTPNPASPGINNYTILSILDNNGCQRNSGFTDALASINVSAPLTSISYGTNPATYCPGLAIASNNPTVSGGTATSYSVSPALPTGLTLNTSTGVITGTPNVYSTATDYTVTATNTCGSVNATINISTTIPGLSTTPGTRCGTGSVSLSANTNSNCITPTINWYAALTGGSSLGAGNNFNTPGISGNTNYFAEESFTVGESNLGGSSVSNTTGRGLVFDLFESIVLRSVQVNNTSGTGSVTVGLRNSSGSPVSGVSDVTVSNLPTGTQTITLNWSIPAGTDYRILYTSGTRSLRRTDPYTFPESIGVGIIKGNYESGFLTTRYNYFYNWVIARTRVSALATVNPLPTITLNPTAAIDRGNNNINLSYSGTTASPNDYSITWNAAALLAGFSNITNTSLPATPIALTVPPGADATTYNGSLTVRNTTTGCISINNAIAVTINKTNLTVTADDKNKTADGNAFTGFTAGITGFINGENISVVSGTVSYTGNATTATLPGNYTITPVVTGLSATNYNFVPANGTLVIDAISQNTAGFRSKANGNFSAAATWEYDLGGGNWQNASQAPGSSNSVNINHDVTLDQDYLVGTAKNFVLGTGAVLTIQPLSTLSINGNADFDAKPVTIQSDNTGTGSIGEITGTLINASNVTIERYIPNNGFRSWRLLSVPTFGSGQTIRQAWQEGNANPLPLQNNLPHRGTQISGTGSIAAAQAAGFDTAILNPSLQSWTGTTWAGVSSTNLPINNFNAYFLFIRGERSKGAIGAVNNTSATTLRTNGTIYTGDQITNINANSFGLVANLYPSSIDFTGLTHTGGVSNLFYVWDSKKLNGNSLGMYQTFSATNGYNCMINGGSYALGQPNTVIESGQAFFVKAGNSAGSITLKESAKISNSNGSLGFRPSTAASAIIKIDTRLYANIANGMLDANVVVFDAAYSNDIDGDDALKFSNTNENIGIQKGTSVLVIEGRQPVTGGDVIQFKMWNMQRRNYTLELVGTNMTTQGVSAVLEDTYLQTSTPLDLSGATQVNFTVDANAASSANNRFRIVFRQLAPVPVNFVSITGYRTNTGVKVDWKSASERGIKNYVIERSADGRNFTTVGTIPAASNNAIEISYNFTDASAPSTALLYRIKSEGINNEIRYSPIARINAVNIQSGFAVSPNPVENGIMNLQFKNQQPGKYGVRIIGNTGETISIYTVKHVGGNSNHTINLAETMARGTYNVEITAPDNSKTVQTLLVNKK